MSETPRTDAAEHEADLFRPKRKVVSVEHSRQLERELSAAESKVDALMREQREQILTPANTDWGRGMLAERDELMREKEELIEAAKAVVWFDWSDNDEDAVRAVERLRALVREQQP